jgi:hypothetical protein
MKLRLPKMAAYVHSSMGSATTGIGPLLIALAVAALTPIRGFGICSAQTFFTVRPDPP